MPKTKKANRTRSAVGCAVLLFLLASLMYSADTAICAVKDGLYLCAVTVIPSLFPFMVLSELIVASNGAKQIGRVFAPVFSRLFGISKASSGALALGALCGFPIGARSAISLYRSGEVEKDEISKLLCFCNNPSSAFIINAVGISLFNSKVLGRIMFFSTLLSAATVGIVINIFDNRSKKNEQPKANDKPLSSESKKFSAKLFTDAVSNSASSMIAVCAFVVFFSAIIACVSQAASKSSVPKEILACLFGFFELTSGAAKAASVDSPTLAACLCAAICGWSGLSVHFQIMSICANTDIPFRRYFAAKGAQGALNFIFVYLGILIFNPKISSGNTAVSPTFREIPQPIAAVALLCFAMSAVIFIVKLITYTVNNRQKTPFLTKKSSKWQ